ncbi:hypothetical protein Cgig2_007329 [Carnegiea gigantea]|uniref:Uncharacterized protein n=1 Tax=Carnegiea gigantea TaxID=171969 RepID=A0A9Q1QSC8_9CARY|nr:hypothetical protein Cgig2_007329 [Carnegiea gigantea]
MLDNSESPELGDFFLLELVIWEHISVNLSSVMTDEIALYLWIMAVVPLLQGYEDAGDFTVTERVKTSVHRNLVFYLIAGTIGLIGLALPVTMRSCKFPIHLVNTRGGALGFAMACSNTFGLVTGAFLLGFGLSEIPRSLWKKADWTFRQKALSHKIAGMVMKLDDAHQNFSNAIVVAQATSNQMSKRDPLRPCMDVIDNMRNNSWVMISSCKLSDYLISACHQFFNFYLCWFFCYAMRLPSNPETDIGTIMLKPTRSSRTTEQIDPEKDIAFPSSSALNRDEVKKTKDYTRFELPEFNNETFTEDFVFSADLELDIIIPDGSKPSISSASL